jgi:hypothetical protein
MRLRSLLLAAALGGGASAACAQAAVTVYGGWQGGGSFTDVNDDERDISLDSGGVFALSVDWLLADGRQLQVFVSQQKSGLPGSAFGTSGTVSLDVTYVHVGGRVFFSGDPLQGGGYVVGGLGATWMSPSYPGYSDEIRASGNIGVGYEWKLAPAVALRAETRGYLTLINSSGSFFCSGGCVVSLKGDALAQASAMLGLSIGF